MTQESPQLPYLSQELRLAAYQTIISGCAHLWSKNQLQTDKAIEALTELCQLAHQDPYFLAHLTSWAINRPSRDLKVTTILANALSIADGMPFSPKSKYSKPNLRYVSAAALQELSPKLVRRVVQLSSLKFAVKDFLNEATHSPTSLKTAVKKYLRFREANLNIVRGIKKAGLAKVYGDLYRSMHESPTDEVAAILRWQQRDHKIDFEESPFGFEGLDDLEVAEKIRKDKLPVLGVVGALEKISPVIAIALLEQASGNQAVILRRTFEEQGILEDEEVMKLYKKKIREAKTALDRAETVSKDASEKVKQVLKEARSEVRKEEMKGLGKIYLHLDYSGSMNPVMQFAIDRGSILAECVDSPQENFRWGIFGSTGEELPLPKEFVADAFAQVLFGKVTMGSTDAFALYETAREFGTEIDIFVSDQQHNMGDLEGRIRNFHKGSDLPKPKACVVVAFPGTDDIKDAYEANGIATAKISPEMLNDSALVVQSVREALRGPAAVIDEIMSTELLSLPDWYFTA